MCVQLFKLDLKADVEKIPDITFQRLRKWLSEKLQSLWRKQSSSSNNSDIIKRHWETPYFEKRYSLEFRILRNEVHCAFIENEGKTNEENDGRI
jgi:hypothetical protein